MLTLLSDLFTIREQFFTSQYDKVAETSASDFSETSREKAQEYIYRAEIALGKAKEVVKATESSEAVSLKAVGAYAQYTLNNKGGLETLKQLIEDHANNETVEVLGAIVLYKEGSLEDAINLISNHEGGLEAISLLVNLRLIQNRPDLASKELKSAKKHAQDNTIFNFAEAWYNVEVGGKLSNQALYFYEDIVSHAGNPRTQAGLIAANLQLQQLPEASTTIETVSKIFPDDPDILANTIALNILNDDDYEETLETLKKVSPDHPAVIDYQEKNELFNAVVAKYAPQVV